MSNVATPLSRYLDRSLAPRQKKEEEEAMTMTGPGLFKIPFRSGARSPISSLSLFGDFSRIVVLSTLSSFHYLLRPYSSSP